MSKNAENDAGGDLARQSDSSGGSRRKFRPDTVPPLDASGQLGQGLRLQGICPPRSTACQAQEPTEQRIGGRTPVRP
jgi:hypothetical protein